MVSFSRRTAGALALLLAFLTLPFWLTEAVVDFQNHPHDSPAAGIRRGKLNDPTEGGTPEQATSSLTEEDLPALTIIDAGWIRGVSTVQERIHPQSVLRWQPGTRAPKWRLETGHVWGALSDPDDRLYLMEQEQLTVLQAHSGAIRRRYQTGEPPSGGPQAGYPFPIDRIGRLLLLRNHAMYDNLLAFDLSTGMYLSETWSACEYAYPGESVYLPGENAIATFCMDFSSGMQGSLTKLDLDDGRIRSIEMPILGTEDYMVGNGFATAGERLAYIVDSDAGALVEIDLEAMEIMRRTLYRPESGATIGARGLLTWLLDLAAAPAQAKRWSSRPAVSPGGRYLIVDGGFGIGGGATTTAWLIDLRTLGAIERIDLPRSPQGFLFPNSELVYILLETQVPESAQILVYDLETHRSLRLDLPTPGRVTQILP